MNSSPNPALMSRYCDELLPGLLAECDVEAAQIDVIVKDVHLRVAAFAALDRAAQDIITAPFFEDVAAYKPADASTFLKAAVAVTVRNSLLEDSHADGPVESGGLTVITELAAAPLSHLLATDPSTVAATVASPFADLATRYPRAWTAMQALVDGLESGGRTSTRFVDTPIPALPAVDALDPLVMSTTHKETVIESAIADTFNEHLVDRLRRVIESDAVLFVPSLSRISRNSDKLFRVIELLLANHVPILTTNYLLRSEDVWVRRGDLLAPNLADFHTALEDSRGLVGTHRKIAAAVSEDLR